jgi:hypothetical protein
LVTPIYLLVVFVKVSNGFFTYTVRVVKDLLEGRISLGELEVRIRA